MRPRSKLGSKMHVLGGLGLVLALVCEGIFPNQAQAQPAASFAGSEETEAKPVKSRPSKSDERDAERVPLRAKKSAPEGASPRSSKPETKPKETAPSLPSRGTPASPSGRGIRFRPLAFPVFGDYPPPPGYVEDSRANSGLVWGGGITLATSYALGIGFGASRGFDQGLGWVALPLFGPFIAAGQRDLSCTITVSTASAEECQRKTVDEAKTLAVLAGVGVAELVGGALLTFGLLDRTRLWVRSDLKEVAIAPYVLPGGRSGSGGGLELRGAF